MALVAVITGSPSSPSRTQKLAAYVGERLERDQLAVEHIDVRALPAADLLHGRADAEGLRAAFAAVERADGLVIATPVYKAAYTGVLKAFLDLLPQLGLTGKTVLPLATGGTLAHVLAVDYALRPVLQSLGAHHVVQGLFVLDKLLVLSSDTGALEIESETRARLDTLVDSFARSLRLHAARGSVS
jgi:FMN reductase